ncbi:LysR family transcriptional regulator [Sinorhizobium fredii]|uniref:LysR family transcriptional regulator n=1 Tax=Rhizobium fredii TaxID=380 RepID=A0A2A6LSE4_RHIFR|nr:LysR substrate-binding domain-containing protein [Sinorhizobium fredii]PDT45237.1 LysR family transcriptional regulator [Sinorhizobium fredii]
MAGGQGPYTFPPLNALRMFESSARHLNFRIASEELGVTQGAVAQQVRALEKHLNTRLFDRRARGLELTEAGRRYLKPLQSALSLISDATAELKPAKTVVTISVTPSFAAKWLIPRLGKFSDSNAETEVQVLATNGLANFQSDGVDLAVRQTKPPFGSGLTGDLLFPMRFIAVCSPAIAAAGPIRTAKDLPRHVLLHDAHGMWPVFLERTGIAADIRTLKSLRFSHSSLAIDAAIAGQGIALATEALVADDLAAGRLCRPLDFAVTDELGFYIVHPRSPRKAEHVRSMRDWLLAQSHGSRYCMSP